MRSIIISEPNIRAFAIAYAHTSIVVFSEPYVGRSSIDIGLTFPSVCFSVCL